MPSVSLRLTFASAVACTIALFLSSTPINAFAIRNHSHSHSNSHSSRTNATKLQAKETNNNNSEKKGTINPLRLAVLKLGLTELKWTSPLNYEKRVGTYDCASCGTVLFDSSGKYDSGSGWPSFWKTKDVDRVAYKREWDGRVECSCGSCGGHLGAYIIVLYSTTVLMYCIVY